MEISKRVKFEEEYKTIFGTLELYFVGDTSLLKDLIGDKYPEADGMTLCIEVPADKIVDAETSVRVSPFKADEDVTEDYDWNDINLPEDEINALLRLRTEGRKIKVSEDTYECPRCGYTWSEKYGSELSFDELECVPACPECGELIEDGNDGGDRYFTTLKPEDIGGAYSLEEIEKKIREYTELLLHTHDLSITRNKKNKAIYDKIVKFCMNELRNPMLLSLFEGEEQIRYFVRQSILYLVFYSSPEENPSK